MIFTKLPWKVPSLIQNFVPSHIRLFHLDGNRIFIAWRKNVSVVLAFSEPFVPSAAIHPETCQVVRTSEEILDIVQIQNCIFFVSTSGLVQILCSVGRRSAIEDPFYLKDVHKLSTLKCLLTVCKITDEDRPIGESGNFCAVTRSIESSEIFVELYNVSCKSQIHTQFTLVSVLTMPFKAPFKFDGGACIAVHCTKKQVMALFQEYDCFQVLLLGFQTGHLFCVPHHTSAQTVRCCPTPRLIYQSPLAITGVFCPRDGSRIVLSIDGAVFVTITSFKHLGGNITSLKYMTVSTPCSMKHVCVPKSDLILFTDSVDLWKLQSFDSEFSNATVLPLKGVAALCHVDGADLILAATAHHTFYELNSLAEEIQPAQSFETNNLVVWSGVNLDKPLQYIQEMKEQTELLALLRMQQDTEHSIITALSTAARGQLLTQFFTMSVKVDVPCSFSQSFRNPPTNDQFSDLDCDFKWEYCFTVEIVNNSNEEFLSSTWSIGLEIHNPCGRVISRQERLTRSFTPGSCVSTVTSISFSPEEMSFPLTVKAHLLAELSDEGNSLGGQWLTISLGELSLNVSYFITVATQAPQFFLKDTSDFFNFISKISSISTSSDSQKSDPQKLPKITHNVPVPEAARHIPLFLDKFLENCQHRVDKNKLEGHLKDRNHDNSIWIGVNGNFVELTFKKSCSLSISSDEVQLLHLIKSWILTVLSRISKSSKVSNCVVAKATNLKSVLEMQHFEVEDEKRLLTIYQELRLL